MSGDRPPLAVGAGRNGVGRLNVVTVGRVGGVLGAPRQAAALSPAW